MQKITHYELCKKTAKRFVKKSNIVLYEYNNMITNEFPDVLCYQNALTSLYEIKVDYKDFLKDNKKDCRVEKKIKYSMCFRFIEDKIKDFMLKDKRLEELIIEKPHLGSYRYYVCPKGLINPEEVKNGWGLYWFDNKRFFIKKESKRFKNNIYEELKLLEHAFKKYYSGYGKNILVNGYR